MVIPRQKLGQPLIAILIAIVGWAVVQGQPASITSRSTLSPPAQTEKLLDEALTAFEKGDLATARNSFQKVLNRKPNEVIALTYLGLIADGEGDLKEAERFFAAAVKSSPSLASVRNNYGAILMRTGQVELAAAQFEASLTLDRNQSNALINLGQIRFESGAPDDLSAALELFTQAYSIQPDVEIARALTVISLRRKDPKAAASHYREYSSRLSQESGTTAHEATARAELGTALLEAGLLREAELELAAVVSLDPANSEPVLRLARVYLARKDLPGAGRTLEGAVARGIDEAPVYALLAEVYEKSGHLENAIPAMRLAIQRDPQSEKYRFAYGILLTNAYAPAAAVIRLEEALKSFPESSRLWFALGLAHFKHSKNADAALAFKRASELDPKFAAAFAYLGVTRIEVGAYDEGISLYSKALEVDPKLGVIHYLIAEALLKQTEADSTRIETHLKRAVALDATLVLARLSLAKLYMRGARWTQALNELETIIKVDAEVAETYYQLGRVYVRLKQPQKAQEALATFKRLSETQKERERTELHEITKRLSTVLF